MWLLDLIALVLNLRDLFWFENSYVLNEKVHNEKLVWA